MPKLFSYIVDYDHKLLPNPFGGFCTLAKSKSRSIKRDIIEMAEVGHRIAGTSGADCPCQIAEGVEQCWCLIRLDNRTFVGLAG